MMYCIFTYLVYFKIVFCKFSVGGCMAFKLTIYLFVFFDLK